MSWPQRAGGAAPAHPQRPGPPRPQGYNNQQNMYPNYQGAPPPAGNTQQQYWQAQQPQYNQQYGQVYQQQDYGNNANQFYQQTPQYNQNYASQGYTDTQQQQYQQGYYQNQTTQQQQGYQAQPKADSWEDNWDWGWDEASKQAQQAAAQQQTAVLPTQPPQQQVYNNANVIEESFASTDSWNWSMDDKKESKETAPAPKQEPAVLPAEKPAENKPVTEHPPRSASNASSHGPTEEVRTLSDRDVVKERLPNLALGKRLQLENLTPQWSIESQMSQESSDGPQTHSEGTYRSENQSRNSSKSSPGVNTENSNFNYSQSALEDYTPSNEWSRHSNEDTLVDNNQTGNRRESHDELTNSLQEMNITNRENPAPEHAQVSKESGHGPPSVSPANLPPPVSSFMPPPTMPVPTMPPAPPVASGAGLPPSSSTTVMPPPTNFPQTSSSTNPFKQAAPFTHKKVASASPSLQSFPPTSSTNLTSPSVVNKMSQHRVPVGFGANLETTPDNSERPDQPQMSAFRPTPIPQQVPDNLEVAPQNDRNQYLQTAHLSSSDYGENTDFSRNVPPPGLRRMVVGQQESEYGQSLNISGDEPPPGLARMVPGQQTEADSSYNQPDNYMERHIDGQLTDNSGRPYRQADGQQTPENYSQPPPSRGSDRRPIGLDRMVPGEPSNDEYPQYQTGNYSANEQRVVTGVDHDYPMPTDAGPTDIREQNVDGSDYSEQTPRTAQRNVIGARDVPDATQDFNALPEDQQREITMEGENLQDLSIIAAPDMTYSREQTFDGADMNATDGGTDRKTDLSDSIEHPTTSSRRQSLNRGNTSGDDSDRDRAFKSSPRRDRDKHKSSRDRDRDRDRDKEGGRYSRGDRKYDRDRDERRSGRDKERTEKDREREWDRDRDRREREESPHARRHRRSTRSRRYETEDTDYYSDRERDRRAYREGSYASKPPRPEDSRRHERSRRYNTIERDRRPEEERDRRRDRDRHRDERHRSERHRDDRDRYEGRYRDIDPTRKHGNLRAEREDEEMRRGELYSSASRPDSREGPGAAATDEDLNDTLAADSRRRDRRSRHPRPDPYYDRYAAGGYPDAYSVQRQQYEYYERLRATDPHAYLQLYKQIMAGRAPAVPVPGLAAPAPGKQPYAAMYDVGYEPRAEERGSVHSGRSSANGLKGNDTYYGARLGALRADASSLRDAPSLRTDLSDRELNTDASLNLHLEESTVRSERMTPFKFSTAHVKGNISSRNVVVVRPSYPVDGLPATVHIMSLAAALARDPMAQELAAYPGPLVKGVSHKMSVIEYCLGRARGAGRGAGRAAPRDTVGYVLVWELLALLLRQNGVVVGTDIAELLMKNKREYEYKPISSKNSTHNESRRGSSMSGREEERACSPEQPSPPTSDLTPQDEVSSPSQQPVDEKAALDKLREYLTYGNRQEALEWAMSHGLWGHAMTLAGSMERRARAGVAARFLQAVPRADPLHTLYAHLQARQPPAATCVSDERWGDWRPHAAIMLSNTSAKPDHDRRTLTQLGDSLLSRGQLYSAQFCYVSAGVGFSRHPLAPLQPAPAPGSSATQPRLALLLGDARATTLAQLATNQAIFATEIYEYALSLNQDYVLNDLQVYKLILATRLVDVGQYERALGYAEAAARAVTRDPRAYSPLLIQQLASLADRLKYHDPALHDDPPLVDEGGDSGEPSPRHHQQWLDDVKNVAQMLTAEAEASLSTHTTPQHNYYQPPPAQPVYASWGEQTQQQEYQSPQPQTYEPEETADYSAYYQQPAPPVAEPTPAADATATSGYEDWPRQDEHGQQQGYDSYWQGDGLYSYAEPAGAGGVGGAGGEEAPRPMITMPGASKPQRNVYGDYDERSSSPDNQNNENQAAPKTPPKKNDKPKQDGGGGGGKQNSGWLGGILNKLSLRAPNQMILPDDKNPTIVWDPERKRWRNTDADSDEADAAPPPPPRLADLQQLNANMQQNAGGAPPQPSAPGGAGAPPPAAAPSAAPVSNIFKMQKGRHIKKSYVDVFNPSGAATRALPPAAEVLGPPPPASAAPPAYFIPPPAPAPATNNQLQLKLSIPSTPEDSSNDSPLPSPSRPSTERSRNYNRSGYPSGQDTDEDGYRLQSGI